MYHPLSQKSSGRCSFQSSFLSSLCPSHVPHRFQLNDDNTTKTTITTTTSATIRDTRKQSKRTLCLPPSPRGVYSSILSPQMPNLHICPHQLSMHPYLWPPRKTKQKINKKKAKNLRCCCCSNPNQPIAFTHHDTIVHGHETTTAVRLTGVRVHYRGVLQQG